MKAEAGEPDTKPSQGSCTSAIPLVPTIGPTVAIRRAPKVPLSACRCCVARAWTRSREKRPRTCRDRDCEATRRRPWPRSTRQRRIFAQSQEKETLGSLWPRHRPQGHSQSARGGIFRIFRDYKKRADRWTLPRKQCNTIGYAVTC